MEPVITEQDLQTHDEHLPEPKSGGGQIETITTHSPEANACQQPSEAEGSWQTQRKIGRRLRGARGAGRCRGRLVRDSGEPGELADAEEDWSEAQGSQGSYLARALRKSEGWCCLRLDRGEKPCMVAILSQSQVISKDTIFLGERECV